MTAQFYKFENEELLSGLIINNADGSSLHYLERDQYSYPYHGWTWFESEADAKAFFGIKDDGN